jgi:hypothetical protein
MLLHVQQPQEAKDRSGHGHRGAPFRHPRGGDCKHRDEVADSPQRRRQLQAVVSHAPPFLDPGLLFRSTYPLACRHACGHTVTQP